MDQEEFKYHKRGLKGLIGLFLIVLIIFVGAKAVNEIKKPIDISNISRITVSGEGKVFAKPDIGKVSISVVNEEKTVAEAQTKSAESINKVIEFLKSSGVEEKDIKTTNYSISPQYDYLENQGRVFRGYEVRQRLEVKIRDLAKSGEILAGATEAGANQVGSLSFTIDEEEIIKQEARQKAIENAKKKAQKLAKDLGVKLGRVVSFNESSFPSSPVFFEARALDIGGGAPNIPTGENEITVNVSVVYQIK
jgi:hypothetical protein